MPTPSLRRLARRLIVLGIACAAAIAAGAPAQERIALVIGNASYPTAPLRNPVNDAKAIADRLRTLGFEVDLETNVSQREMTRAVSRFGQRLKPGSVALFYYAGHGMQVRGRNFLIPVDADIKSEASARSESVDLELVLDQLGPARLSMVILDACRNNPFEGLFRSAGGGGLAQIDAPKGTLLAYATAPGKVASDGDGANGLYTSELLKAMDIPGIKVEEVFKAVRVNVIKATASQQIPWESSSLTGDYYFRPAVPRQDVAKAEESKQAELQAKLDAERRQREKDAQMLKAEMESLRQEVRRLTQSSAPAQGKAPVVAANGSAQPAKEAKESSAAKEPAAPKQEPPSPRKEAATPNKEAKAAAEPRADASGKPPVATHPADSKVAAAAAARVPRESASQDWARRIERLESQRGQLGFSKAIALLLDPLTEEQLLVLVGKERALKDMPYSSALALGITANGRIASGRTWGERTRDFAADTAVERCSRASQKRCSAVMVNGEFRESGFLEWARSASGRNLQTLRADFLRRPDGR